MYLNTSTRNRWILTALAFSAFLLLVSVSVANAGGKVDVCHVPPGNPANAHTISIAEEAWDAGHSPHNTHSLDYLGSCPDPTSVPPSPSPEATGTPPVIPTDQPTRDPTPTRTWVGPSPTPTVEPTEPTCEILYAPTVTAEPIAPACTIVPACVQGQVHWAGEDTGSVGVGRRDILLGAAVLGLGTFSGAFTAYLWRTRNG